MAKELNYTAEDVYSKIFKTDIKGYQPAEVDSFLDEIIEDYQTYDEQMAELSQAVTRYETKIRELQQQIFKLQTENKTLQEKLQSGFVSANSDQVDILQRLARLEAAVFTQAESDQEAAEE